MIYEFEEVDATLDLLPLSARRALDVSGLKVSLAAWRSMPLGARQTVVALGAEHVVDCRNVQRVLSRANVVAEAAKPTVDPDAREVAEQVEHALGHEIPLATWRALTPFERYVLVKLSAKPRGDRLAQAYHEIAVIPEPRDPRPASTHQTSTHPVSTHLTRRGEVHMVDVGGKEKTARRATALARVTMDPATAARLRDGRAAKGDVLATARVAGIQAAKRTPDLIPLCHVVALTRVEIDLCIEEHGVAITAMVEARDRTGVEMEAMVAASAAALTIYDMLKGFDRAMAFEVMLSEKAGGKSGSWTRASEEKRGGSRR
jgi:cyclic pyranopterin phosphate synthase